MLDMVLRVSRSISPVKSPAGTGANPLVTPIFSAFGPVLQRSQQFPGMVSAFRPGPIAVRSAFGFITDPLELEGEIPTTVSGAAKPARKRQARKAASEIHESGFFPPPAEGGPGCSGLPIY